MGTITMSNNVESLVLLLVVVFILMSSSFVKFSVASCVPHFKAYGEIGDTVSFTICLRSSGSNDEDFMYLEIDGQPSHVPRNRKVEKWFWTWVVDEQRREALVKVEIYQHVLNTDIRLGFHVEDGDMTYFNVTISEQNYYVGENLYLKSTSSPSSSTTASTNKPPASASPIECVPDLEAAGEVGGQVVFTICLGGDHPLNDYMDFRYPNNTWSVVRKGDTSGGISWESERTRSSIRIIVTFSISSEDVFGIRQVGFGARGFETIRIFNLTIIRGDGVEKITEPPPKDVDGSVTPAVVGGVIVCIFIIAVVGFISYRFKDKIVSKMRYKKRKEQKQVQRIVESYEKVEVVLSNPVYGMTKEPGGHERNERVYQTID